VAAFDPRGQARDALTVLDCDGSSATYSQVVGWAELPTGGNELHHFGGTRARAPCATAGTPAIWNAAT
jgi:56kDa selenium binding protein (SBP56)